MADAKKAADELGGKLDSVQVDVNYEKYWDRAKVPLKAGDAVRPTQAAEVGDACLQQFRGQLPAALKQHAKVPTLQQIISGNSAIGRVGGGGGGPPVFLAGGTDVDDGSELRRNQTVIPADADSLTTPVRVARNVEPGSVGRGRFLPHRSKLAIHTKHLHSGSQSCHADPPIMVFLTPRLSHGRVMLF